MTKKDDDHLDDQLEPVAVTRQLLAERGTASRFTIAAAVSAAVAVLLVLVTMHFAFDRQDSTIADQAAEISKLQGQVDRGKTLEGDVAVLKQQVTDLHGVPAVPDRPPIVEPTPTTTTTTTRQRSTTTTTTRQTSPTTSGPPGTSPTTTAPQPTTTTTQPPKSPPSTTCVVVICVPR